VIEFASPSLPSFGLVEKIFLPRQREGFVEKI